MSDPNWEEKVEFWPTPEGFDVIRLQRRMPDGKRCTSFIPLDAAQVIREYQVREAEIVEALKFIDLEIRTTKEGSERFMDGLRAYVANLLASLPQAVIPISDQDPEKLRAEGVFQDAYEFLCELQVTIDDDRLYPLCCKLREALESLSNQERID